MLRNENFNRILLACIAIVLLLSLFITVIGIRTNTFHQLSINGLGVMDNWSGLERIKNDFLLNRSNITVEGDFDYKKNVHLWKEQTKAFEEAFNELLNGSRQIPFSKRNILSVEEALSIWKSTYKSISRVQEALEQLERIGLDELVFPQLISKFYILRNSEKLGFEDTVLLMNLINQFSVLDIASKEFSRIIKSFVSDIQIKNKTNIQILTVLIIFILVFLSFSVLIIFLSLKKLHESDQNLKKFKHEETLKAMSRFITGHESLNNIINRVDSTECPLISGFQVIPILLRINHFAQVKETIGATEIENLILQSVEEIENRLNRNNYLCTVIPLEEGLIIYHMLHGTLLAETVSQRTDLLIKEIRSLISPQKDFSYSLTYGPVHGFPDEAQENYIDLHEASFYRILYGYERIISTEEIQARKEKETPYPLHVEKQLTDFLKQGKIDRARDTYSHILKELTESSYPVLRTGLNRLIIAITSALDTLEKFNNLNNHIDIIAFNQYINSMETIQEIDSAISGLIEQVSDELVLKKESYNYHQIGKVNEIIQKEYSNPNLSAGLISERLGLSTAYLGRVYRNQTGTSVQETINQRRIEVAGELLVREKITIEEISSSVGISNNMYFYTLFKKTFGVTPAEYRKLHREKNSE